MSKGLKDYKGMLEESRRKKALTQMNAGDPLSDAEEKVNQYISKNTGLRRGSDKFQKIWSAFKEFNREKLPHDLKDLGFEENIVDRLMNAYRYYRTVVAENTNTNAGFGLKVMRDAIHDSVNVFVKNLDEDNNQEAGCSDDVARRNRP